MCEFVAGPGVNANALSPQFQPYEYVVPPVAFTVQETDAPTPALAGQVNVAESPVGGGGGGGGGELPVMVTGAVAQTFGETLVTQTTAVKAPGEL